MARWLRCDSLLRLTAGRQRDRSRQRYCGDCPLHAVLPFCAEARLLLSHLYLINVDLHDLAVVVGNRRYNLLVVAVLLAIRDGVEFTVVRHWLDGDVVVFNFILNSEPSWFGEHLGEILSNAGLT